MDYGYYIEYRTYNILCEQLIMDTAEVMIDFD